jgi:RecB family exonuclease
MDREYTIEKLSASRIKKYQSCPKQYFYDYLSDVEPPEEGEVEHFEIGNAVHDSIEEALHEENVLDLKQNDLYDRLKEIESELDYNYSDRKKVETCLEFAAKFINKYVTSITTVEDEMNMEEMGIEFTGFADLIGNVDDGDGELSDVVIDWKTGKENPEWKEKIQGGVYVKMFYEEYGRWPESIQFVYLNEGTRSVHNRISDGEIMWNDMQNEYWDEIKGYISNMTNSAYKGEFEAKPSDNCYWCDFKYSCEDGGRGAETATPQHYQIDGVI